MFGRKERTVRATDRPSIRARCPACGVVTTLQPCTVEKTYTAYHFVDLWSSASERFRCVACSEIVQHEPETSNAADDPVERVRAKARARAQRRAAHRQRCEEDDAQRASRARTIDDELTAIRRKVAREKDR